MNRSSGSTPPRALPVVLVLAAIVVVYLTAAMACALTQRPWWDEAVHGSPALCLITRGFMGTPVLDAFSRWFPLPGINEYTYQMMPLYMLAQVPWYKLFGFGVIQMRMFSMFWGLIALASWFFIMKSLSRDIKVALLTVGLLAIDYTFVHSSSEGRPDTMSMALGFAGLATYLTLREEKFWLGVFLSHTLVAGSFFTHPNGVMPFIGLLFVAVYYDWTRIRLRYLVTAAIPYLVGAICWGIYISKAPEFFKAQMSGNASGRFQGLISPASALKAEIGKRYLGFLGGLATDLSMAHRLKLIILATYVLAIVGVILTREIRRHKGYRALVIITGVYFTMMTFWDGAKSPLYMVHIVPLFVALLAIWIQWCWEKRIVPAPIVLGWITLFVAVNLGGVFAIVKRDSFGKTYKPAIAFLKQNVSSNASIMGSSELGFDLGFFGNLTDDIRLGYLSGKTPDYIVVDSGYEEWFKIYSVTDPKNFEFIKARLSNEYHPVFTQPPYTIYARQRTSAGNAESTNAR
ncbi:MAG: glycosyltransferase family 39 protein [Pyrinomonadaceae bacterium]|nr:glycosyltransferase family 39 protein [Pyrinomonadaceae bacterium]